MHKFCRTIYLGALINNAIDDKTVMHKDILVYI